MRREGAEYFTLVSRCGISSHSVEIDSRAAANADTASKSAIVAAAACQSAVAATMKLTASQRETVSKTTASNVSTASMSILPQGVHLKTNAPCPATPERIRSYYDVRSSRQCPNINVLSLTTTRVQSTNYPSMQVVG